MIKIYFMSKNKNIFNGNTDTNIIGDNNRVEKNVTNISNINNNINNGNNSSSNDDVATAIFVLLGIAIFLIAVISFIYAIYFPIIFLILKILAIALLFSSLYGLWRDRQHHLTNLFSFLSAIISLFHFLPMLYFHFKWLGLKPYSVEFDKEFPRMAWNFYQNLPENVKSSLLYNIIIAIFFLISFIIYIFAIFKNNKTAHIIGLIFYLIIPCVFYFLIKFKANTIGWML